MSNIDKRAQKELYAKVEQQAHSLRGNYREYQAVTGLCPVSIIEMHAQKIQALLDELEAAEKRITELEALTSGMEQEPVAYTCIDALDDVYCGSAAMMGPVGAIGEVPLYTAPQLPQSAVEEIAMQNFRSAMEGIGHIIRAMEETFGGLHGTHCEPDVLVECKAICDAIHEAYRKTAPVVPDDVLDALQKVARIRLDLNDFDGDRRGITDCLGDAEEALIEVVNRRAAMLQAGNSPVIPDGWQLVPKEPTEAMNKAGWAAINGHDEINPTYRAMLAAAPQQEVKK